MDNEEKLIDQQEALNKQETIVPLDLTKSANKQETIAPLNLTKSADAHQLKTSVNHGLLAVETKAVLNHAKDEAHSLEQDSKWEFKNLSDPQEFQKAISILTVFYQEILEDT